jgi:hypothetical protein
MNEKKETPEGMQAADDLRKARLEAILRIEDAEVIFVATARRKGNGIEHSGVLVGTPVEVADTVERALGSQREVREVFYALVSE